MRIICAVMAIALTGAVPAAAQPYGGRDYGYGGRDSGYGGRDFGYGGRDGGYRDRGYEERGDDRRDRGRRGVGFDEREYLRCNPDVRRAVNSGQMESGSAHYRVFGRREGRRLSC